MAMFGLMMIAVLGSAAFTTDHIGYQLLMAQLAIGTTWAIAPVLRKRWIHHFQSHRSR